jgi:hypothetical protein
MNRNTRRFPSFSDGRRHRSSRTVPALRLPSPRLFRDVRPVSETDFTRWWNPTAVDRLQMPLTRYPE